MSKQAWVGLFTLLGIVAVFAIFFVLADLGTRARGYRIGVRFQNAGGMHDGALVFLSGVPIGAVDDISLLPDYSSRVILAIKPKYEIPKGSKFLIQAPITGEPSILIEPPANVSQTAATLPHEVLPVDQMPRGTNPTSIADLLEQGQGEVRRLDDMLAQLEAAEPQLLTQLKSTLGNANELTTNANHSLTTVTSHVAELTDSLQKNLTLASNNVLDLTGGLDNVVKRDSTQIDQLLTQLNTTSKSFGETVDALHGVATNPKLRTDLLSTTRDFALTAKTFADLTLDLRKVTGNEQTQAQLRDTVAHLDATAQKVNSLVGDIGGTSKVYGVDPGATPAPAAPAPPAGSTAPPGAVSTSAPKPNASAPSTSNSANVPAGTSGGPTPRVTNPKLNAVLSSLRERLNIFSKDLVQLQVRASELSPQRPGSADRNTSPLLTSDRGPQSDFNLFVLPRAPTGFQVGVNDVGSNGTSTANAMLLNRGAGFTYGGGIEYSRAGLIASVARKTVGLETRVYDLRHPTIDTYFNVFVAPKLQIFAGERDLSHSSRRTALGLQFEL